MGDSDELAVELAMIQIAIARQGAALMHAHAPPDIPMYHYTVGLWGKHRHPEIIITQMRPERCAKIMPLIYHTIRQKGRYRVGRTYRSLGNFPTRFGAVTEAWKRRLCGWADLHYTGWEFEVIQLIIPDRAGRFKGDPGWDRSHSTWPLLDSDPTVSTV